MTRVTKYTEEIRAALDLVLDNKKSEMLDDENKAAFLHALTLAGAKLSADFFGEKTSVLTWLSRATVLFFSFEKQAWKKSKTNYREG